MVIFFKCHTFISQVFFPAIAGSEYCALHVKQMEAIINVWEPKYTTMLSGDIGSNLNIKFYYLSDGLDLNRKDGVLPSFSCDNSLIIYRWKH